MKKYFAIGLLILISALFAYHFFAANNAEVNIDTSIQEITTTVKPQLSVSYSNIAVSPFSGDVLFTDLNIIINQDIRRVRSARFDFSYLDFLNISLFGAEYGLKRIDSGKIELRQLSFTNRQSLAELKIDSLAMDYQGDLWELLAIGFEDSQNGTAHNIDASGTRFTFSRPEILGVVKADTLLFSNNFENNPENKSLAGNASLLGITWSPTKPFQEKYQFFIQGFGYQTNAIPFQEATTEYSYESASNLLSINKLNLRSELFFSTLSGDIKIDSTSFSNSIITDLSIQFGDLSPQLQNFLSNAEKLFGVRIPMTNNKLSIQVAGTFEDPEVKVLEKYR